MSSGRERAVLVWEARHALVTRRLSEIERGLAELRATEEAPSRKRRERMADLEAEQQHVMLAIARQGPSPRAKMG
jgi:hypothetical protein